MDELKFAVKILEGFSYLSSAALVVVAIFGLRQISLSKKSLSLGSKRDALRVTNEQIAVFFGDILNEYEKKRLEKQDVALIKSITLTKAGEPDWDKLSKQLPDLKLNTKKGKEEYIHSIRKAFDNKRLAFNRLEAFSSTFTSGLGDEKTAYVALGRVYCGAVDTYIKALKLFNAEGYYKNTITLYTLWDLRLSKEKIEAKIKEVDSDLSGVEEQSKKRREELEKLKSEINEIEDREITSIGVNG